MSDNMAAKIKALLAKAKGTDNEHEAEIFFNKAFELLEKHQLCIEDLEKDDPIGLEGGVTSDLYPDWNFRLMFPVARYYGCRSVRARIRAPRDGYEMKLVGRQSARITALEMHKYLVATVRRLGREMAAQRGGNASIHARQIGNALSERLYVIMPTLEKAQTKAGQNALITLDGIDAFVKANFPKLGQVKSTGTITSEEARNAAKSISLNKQTGYANQKRLA